MKYINTEIKMKKETQFVLVLFVILSGLAIIYLFDILLAPLVYMGYTVYILLNRGRSLTDKEVLGLWIIIIPFLIYMVTARLGGMFLGLVWVIIWEVFFAILYSSYKKRIRNKEIRKVKMI
jgi:hypothetical protein